MPEKKRLAVYHLTGKITRSIGVIVHRMDSQLISSALKGIQEVVAESRYDCVITHSQGNIEKEMANTRLLFHCRVDGVLASPAIDTAGIAHFTLLANSGIPVVFFGCAEQIGGSGRVIIDNRRSGYLAAEHLINQGCRRIVTMERIETDNGADLAQIILHMEPLPDGLFIADDRAAVACMHALMEAGVRVPDDIAIVGLNNDPIGRLTSPALTTIDYPGYEIGKRAASTLLDRLSGRRAAAHRTITVVPPVLIIRNSSVRSQPACISH